VTKFPNRFDGNHSGPAVLEGAIMPLALGAAPTEDTEK
jgi:hypothetical protein